MGAKVYAPPESVKAPLFSEYERDGRFSMQAATERDQRYYDELRAWLKANGYTSPMAGKVVGWGHADGCAQYMVMGLRPLELIHLPLMDGYRKDAIFERGLTARDIRAHVERSEKLDALLGRKS